VPTEIVVYSCNHCGRRYDDVRQAAECEQRHLIEQGQGTEGRHRERALFNSVEEIIG
jgi:primosomal protein N'